MNQQVSTENTNNVLVSKEEATTSWIKKLTSRKFLMAFVPAIAAICALFGYGENQVVTIASAVVVIVSSVSYMWMEGKCDQESIKQSADALREIIENLQCENFNLQNDLTTAEKKIEMLLARDSSGDGSDHNV